MSSVRHVHAGCGACSASSSGTTDLLLELFGIAKHHRLDNTLNVLVRPNAQQNALRPTASLRPQIGSAID